MTHQLVLIRHAKALAGPVDRDRALAPRGHADAAELGRLLARVGLDRAVVSPARRARQTWDDLQAQLPTQVECLSDDRIYRNELAELLELVRETEPAVGCLALVGHNPSLGELAAGLDDGLGDSGALRQLRSGFATSAVAIFGLAASWDEVELGSARLTRFAVPRGSGGPVVRLRPACEV